MELKIFIIECLILHGSIGARILGFFGSPSRSHFIVQETVMTELARRGHEVTVVAAFNQSVEHLRNYRHVQISDFLDDPILLKYRSETVEKGRSITKWIIFVNKIAGFSMKMLRHPKFLALKNEHFDLLVIGWFMNEYALGLSGHFHCPSVVISANVNFYSIRQFSGNPSSVSTIPSFMLEISPKMMFLDRVLNFIAYVLECAVLEFLFQFYTLPYYNEEFPPDKYPSYNEVMKNVSLVLVTQHFSGRNPEALLPNVIEIEGIHVKKTPSPLPSDIQEFLDGASTGAILFSLGTNLNSSELPQEKITILLNKFRTLTQRVLWKFETELAHLPVNVKIGKWLPQDDILAHPNVKLFISHCGKGGITEAKYHGKPILAIPVFGDQFSNAKQIQNEGWAVTLPFDQMNAKRFSNALDEALNNSTYLQVARKLSTLYRDRPEHPLDRAAYWIEYVIRHDGAKHMQSPAVHLNLVQYYSVDVIAFILVVLWTVVKLIKILLNFLLLKVFGIRRRKAKKE